MSKATVVIGANYGDEGKGLMTDYLANKKNADLVVRFNGGAQAGHTVVTPHGDKHVFSHFGAGTFLQIPTFLSKYFICNPVIFGLEWNMLHDQDSDPKVSVDRRSIVTTPWDMMWNTFLEEFRGESRHGSCGCGIGATMDRAEKLESVFRASGIYSITRKIWFDEIQDYYQEKFFKFEQKNTVSEALHERYVKNFMSSGVYRKFEEDCDFFAAYCTLIEDDETPSFTHAIFEGAQGLALDQHMGVFPHVTRSNTGMRNVINLQREMGFELDEIVYVTRSYLTRHGAGPFKENMDPVEDLTNKPNAFQGELKFRKFSEEDIDALGERVNIDITSNNLSNSCDIISTATTHLDQIDISPFPAKYMTFGPTRNDVKE